MMFGASERAQSNGTFIQARDGYVRRFSVLCLLALVAIGWPFEKSLADDAAPVRGQTNQTVWVGPAGDPNCNHDNLADAITVATNGNLNPVTRYIIRVAGSSYSLQRHTVNFSTVPAGSSELREVQIVGGYSSCSDTGSPPSGSRTTLNANGSCCINAHQVFRVLHDADELDQAFRLVLRNMVLTGGRGGQADGGFNFHGGGMFVRGRPGKLSVHLVNTIVQDNQTLLGSHGGGIHVETTGTEIFDPILIDEPLLYVDDDSLITGNVSSSESFTEETRGGGIHCSDEFEAGSDQFSRYHVKVGGALIRNNRADHGGGVAASGCRVMLRAGGAWGFDLGGNTFYTGGIIENRAPGGNGGGVFAIDGGLVVLDSNNDPDWGGPGNAAAWVNLNEAEFGGGIYASGEGTRVRAWDTWIDSNTAQQSLIATGRGGGLYATDGAQVTLSAGLGLQQACTPVRFPEPTRCNVLIDNVAEGLSGGGIHVADSANVIILNGYIHGNDVTGGTQGAAVRAAGGTSPSARVVLTNTLVSGNHATGNARIISTGVNGEAVLRYSTVAGNDISETSSVISAFAFGSPPTSLLDIQGSIVWADTGTAIVASTGGTEAIVRCSIGHTDLDEVNLIEASSGFYSVVDDPGFRDPAGGNYRLAAGSPAINYCNTPGPQPWDLDFNDRDVVFDGPVGEAENSHPGGIYDLGAYTLLPDLLFNDRFED